MPDSSATFFASTAEHKDTLTYTSPTSGEPVGTSFLTPKTPDDLVKRRKAFKVWADYSNGMLGRTSDYMNSSLMALASAADWFAQADPAFGENIRRYYEQVREEDLLCTHPDPSAGQPGGGRHPAGQRQALVAIGATGGRALCAAQSPR
ncbi:MULTISPECIES: 4-hydroxyphenylacetate 3-hydroxylase N-terminal domain-containing protein [Streptomyces]|nr:MULTISPECIES: 4-hydroxyphenylacetate 3-hydroxylase N-terminal domain-containing protein [Streptomyces]